MIESVTGLLALLAFVSLPGILIIRSGISPEGIGSAIGLSVGTNLFIIMIASMNGFYRQEFLWLWFLLLTFLVIFYHRYGQTLLPEINNDKRNRRKTPLWVISPILLVVAYKSWCLPYYTWDAVASWNRWARNFSIDPSYFQTNNFFYPQFMAWGMSVPYVGSGSPTIEYVSHGFSFFLLLILVSGVCCLVRHLGGSAVLSIGFLFLTLPFASYSGTGYADIGTAAFAALALGWIIGALKNSQKEREDRYDCIKGLISGLTIGVAFLFKQSSVPILFTFTGCYLLVDHTKTVWEKIRFSLSILLGFLGLTLPWILSDHTTLSGSHLLFLVSGIHPDPSLFGILKSGLKVLIHQISIFNSDFSGWLFLITSIVFLGICFPKGRIFKALITSIFLCTLLWMGTASYDTRGLMPVMVPAAVVVSTGFSEVIKSQKWLIFGLTSVCILIFLINQFFPTMKIDSRRIWDWKQGELWSRIPVTANRTEQLRSLQPTLAELEDWKSSLRTINGTVFSDHLLYPSVHRDQVDGGGRWLEELEDNGTINWHSGDFLIISKTQARATKLPHPLTDGRLQLVRPSWKEWLDRALEKGLIEKKGEYPNLTVYQFK